MSKEPGAVQMEQVEPCPWSYSAKTLNGFGANLLWCEVAPRCFSDLLPTRKTDIKALAANSLSHLSKVDFMRFKGSEFEYLLPDRR